jgi:hypothetical protein
MNTLTMSNTLIGAGFYRKQAEAVVEIIDSRNKELSTKGDLKIGFTIIVGFMSAGFGYMMNAINNNSDFSDWECIFKFHLTLNTW